LDYNRTEEELMIQLVAIDGSGQSGTATLTTKGSALPPLS
jgi:hypothetical protein